MFRTQKKKRLFQDEKHPLEYLPPVAIVRELVEKARLKNRNRTRTEANVKVLQKPEHDADESANRTLRMTVAVL